MAMAEYQLKFCDKNHPVQYYSMEEALEHIRNSRMWCRTHSIPDDITYRVVLKTELEKYKAHSISLGMEW